MVEKFEKKKEYKEESKDPRASKAQAIMASKMPESQKLEMLKEIGMANEPIEKGGVPFHVFVQIKKITKTKHQAMKLYPKAKNVSLASIEEWESIFKDF